LQDIGNSEFITKLAEQGKELNENPLQGVRMIERAAAVDGPKLIIDETAEVADAVVNAQSNAVYMATGYEGINIPIAETVKNATGSIVEGAQDTLGVKLAEPENEAQKGIIDTQALATSFALPAGAVAKVDKARKTVMFSQATRRTNLAGTMREAAKLGRSIPASAKVVAGAGAIGALGLAQAKEDHEKYVEAQAGLDEDAAISSPSDVIVEGNEAEEQAAYADAPAPEQNQRYGTPQQNLQSKPEPERPGLLSTLFNFASENWLQLSGIVASVWSWNSLGLIGKITGVGALITSLSNLKLKPIWDYFTPPQPDAKSTAQPTPKGTMDFVVSNAVETKGSASDNQQAFSGAVTPTEKPFAPLGELPESAPRDENALAP
jgi:hypothetical protein